MKGLLIACFAVVMSCNQTAYADDSDDYCNAFAPPKQISITPDGDLFFYTTLTLGNDAQVQVGFEFDGDRWEPVEHSGKPKACQGQYDFFQMATMRVLTSGNCNASKFLYPRRWVDQKLSRYARKAARFCQSGKVFSY